jgi:diamine N-acetyltransferase
VADVRDPEQPVVNVVGERVALGPLRRDLLPTFQRWFNDLPTLRWFGAPAQPMTLERETAWYDDAATAPDPVSFTIYERAAWRPIGSCALNQIDPRHGTADLVILIGERDARGQGYGTEAVRLLLDVAFTALGLHNVRLGVDEANVGARRAYEKAGFKEIGRRRQAIRELGRRWDEVLMDCLATEFDSPVLARVLAPDAPRR